MIIMIEYEKKNYSYQFYELDEIKAQYILHEPQRQTIISVNFFNHLWLFTT